MDRREQIATCQNELEAIQMAQRLNRYEEDAQRLREEKYDLSQNLEELRARNV